MIFDKAKLEAIEDYLLGVKADAESTPDGLSKSKLLGAYDFCKFIFTVHLKQASDAVNGKYYWINSDEFILSAEQLTGIASWLNNLKDDAPVKACLPGQQIELASAVDCAEFIFGEALIQDETGNYSIVEGGENNDSDV